MTAATTAVEAGPADGSGPAPARPPQRRAADRPAIGLSGRILVTRIVGGVAVTNPVPRAAIAGIVLAAGDPFEPCDILLAFADGRAEQRLARLDDDEAVAAWRGFGRDLGLPLILRRATGEETVMERHVGAVVDGSGPRPRRRKPLARRRPRFLMRRKTSLLPLAPAVHAGRELSATR